MIHLHYTRGLISLIVAALTLPSLVLAQTLVARSRHLFHLAGASNATSR